jgi:peptidoglycan/LPS O-acetylase OafA/YrhL
MTVFSGSPAREAPSAGNNLDALRLAAAWLVLYGHAFIFLGLPEPLFLSWLPLGPLGVLIFFTISGYLVSQSWARDPSLPRFLARRALRIFPALVVCTLLSVLVLGPLLTTLPLADYFASPHTVGYLRNIALYIGYYLPGVFEHNRVANAVNGSLWSLPVEFAMYLVIAAVGVLRGNRWVVLALTVLWGLLSVFWAQATPSMFVVYAFDVRQLFLCGTYFMVGAVFQRFDLVRHLSASTMMLAALALLCLERWVVSLPIASWVLLPVVVLAFGFSRSALLERLTRRGDYSYGIYIYAFPVQQSVVFLWPTVGVGTYLIVCTLLTLVLAIGSWHLIEQRALLLKPRGRGAGHASSPESSMPFRSLLQRLSARLAGPTPVVIVQPAAASPVAPGGAAAASLAPTAPEAAGIPLLFAPGHFYSPIADPVDLRAREARIWAPGEIMPGIDLRLDAQLALLPQLAPWVAEIDWPVEQPADPTRYFYGNDQYPVLDAEFLYAALRHFRPRTVIEIGSGFSSLITAEVNRRHLGGSMAFHCVEPYPRQFLIDGVEGITSLVRSKVEDVDLAFFDQLGAGDLLFIDSSHVSKVGSDVNYLFFEVLPRLRPGVMVHVHDIFLPDEYPKIWVIDQGRNWNEQYLLRAFLQFNADWEVLWAAHCMGTRHTAAVQAAFPRYPRLGGGGSFWIRRRG